MNRTTRSRLLVVMFLSGASAALLGTGAGAQALRAPTPQAPTPQAPTRMLQTAAPSFDALLERQDKVLPSLKPEARRRLEAAARELLARMDRPVDRPSTRASGAPAKPLVEVARDVAQTANLAPYLGGGGDMDIMAMALIVMMEAARSAREDLKGIMDGVKGINGSREQLRRELAAMQQIRGDAGASGLSALSQQQQLRMQLALDRISKFEQALSNMLKKIADTQNTIVGNMK